MRAQQALVLQRLLDLLQAEQDLDQAGVVVVEAARDRLAALAIAAELAQLAVGPRRPGVVTDVQARQRPDPVHALRIAQRLVVRELEIGPRLHRLAQEALEIGRVGVLQHASVLVHHPQQAVVVLQPAVRRHQAHEQAGEVAIGWRFALELVVAVLQQVQRQFDDVERFGQTRV